MNQSCDISADAALRRLQDGNARFLAGMARSSQPPLETLAGLAKGQSPFATILGCSDSRVPPESIFDAGLGELFVIRVAGNVLSPEVAGSMQYACSYLGTPLVVVLGHQGCGAIAAALETRFHGSHLRSRIQFLVDQLLPATAAIDPGWPPEVQLARAVENNVQCTMRSILETPEGKARAAEGRIRIVGAIYEITTGRVRFLGPPES